MNRTAALEIRMLAALLIFTLLLPAGAWASPQEGNQAKGNSPDGSSAKSSAAENSNATNKAPVPSASDQFPDSPGTLRAMREEQQGIAAPIQAENTSQQTGTETRPVGTAAAQPLVTTGVAAAQPAGAAIAPAKQRRLRSILLKTGAVVGIGVAVGTVVALSAGSPNKPPGSH